MVKKESLGKIIETDVLVLGGGVTGLWAANRAREFVERVTIVDNGPQGGAGQLSRAGGDFQAVLPGDNLEDWVKDLVYYYDGLCEQDLVEEIYKQSFDRFKDYQRFGCEFLAGPDGKLKGIPQRALDHVKLYPHKLKGTGGSDMAAGIVKEANRLGVEWSPRTLVTDLLTREGRVVGAVGFNTRNGEFYIFKARAVVLALGNQSNRAIHMALRAGAEIRNCEFIFSRNSPRLFAWESQTSLLPLGARWVNKQGEPFMDKYSKLGSNTDFHYNVVSMAIQIREGKGPIYIDLSKMKASDIEMMRPQTGWQRLNYEKLLTLGIDFFKEKTEWIPETRLGTYAGVIADIRGRTLVPGLFAAGRVRSIDPGVYMGGFALCTTSVTGYIAGESAAEYVKSHEPLQINDDEAESFKRALYAPLGKAGVSPKDVLDEVRKAIVPHDVSILKNEASLKRALDMIENIERGLLPRMGARDPHELMKLAEVQCTPSMMKLFLRTSLMRTESRAGHYREDYPERDDKNWLKWIVVRQKDSKLNVRTEPVPFERYKYKPARYYIDNFKFPR